MKKKFLHTLFLFIGFSLLGVSCSKGGKDDPIIPDSPTVGPEQPNYPTFDLPNWSVNNSSSFENTMTVSVVLPDSLRKSELPSDCLAIFCDTDCRGIADRIEEPSGDHTWIAIVYGNSTSESITFKYYSSKTKYMYNSTNTTPFTIDGSLGTIDNPQIIGMRIVTEKNIK